VNKSWITFHNSLLQERAYASYISGMLEQTLPHEIEVYQVGARRLYAKTKGGNFAIFEDELTPEELMVIAKDIAARRPAESALALECRESDSRL
jgi:hypothetical protein